MATMSTKIEKTTDYKQFKFIKGNRPLVPSKVKSLINSFEGGINLFPYCPVLVNERMMVIDGQHRLEVCKKKALPVYYMIVKDFSLPQIAHLNAISTKWKTSDFFNCFIESGNKDYQTLQFFVDKYTLGINIACQLLMNGSLNEGGGYISDAFKNGMFKVEHQEKAEKIMKNVTAYSKLVEDDGILKDRAFIKAINMLMQSNTYSTKDVVEKLTAKSSRIQKKYNHKEYIFHLEELYNKGTHKRIVLWSRN